MESIVNQWGVNKKTSTRSWFVPIKKNNCYVNGRPRRKICSFWRQNECVFRNSAAGEKNQVFCIWNAIFVKGIQHFQCSKSQNFLPPLWKKFPGSPPPLFQKGGKQGGTEGGNPRISHDVKNSFTYCGNTILLTTTLNNPNISKIFTQKLIPVQVLEPAPQGMGAPQATENT